MKCPVCNASRTYRVVDLGCLPLSVLALPDRPDAYASRFPVAIRQCTHCGHAFNAQYSEWFDQCRTGGCTMYNSGSEWASHMQDVAWVVKDLCRELDGAIVEIGAGRGEFASLFHGWNYIAYEPSDDAAECATHCVTRKRYFDWTSMKDDHPDAILLRHVLEHFAQPREFLEELALEAHQNSLTPYMVIEVPNIQPAFEAGRLEDWVYEHAQHFTPDSLRTVLDLSGWHTTEVETLYNDEVILAIASLSDIKCPKTNRIFEAHENLKRTGVSLKCPVFWGGAGKCANTLNMLAIEGPVIVVDSDSRKWGCFVPGTDYEIQTPEILKSLKPKEIIVTTTWRTADIAEQIRALGIDPVILNIVDGELKKYEEIHV